MARKSILVLGGNRFVGKHLVRFLGAQDVDLGVMNRGSTDRHDADYGFKNLTRFFGDRNRKSDLAAVARKKDWDFVFDQICFSANQAEAAVSLFEGRVGHYVVTSSQSVYPLGLDLNEVRFNPWRHEFEQVSDPNQDYAESKRQVEAVFARKADFPTSFVRFPLILGEDDYTGRLDWFIGRVLAEKPIFLRSPKARFNYIHSTEAGRSLGQLMHKSNRGPLNLASVGQIRMIDLLSLIQEASGVKFRLVSQASEDSVGPLTVPSDWTMSVFKMRALGISHANLMDWLPELIRKRCEHFLSKEPGCNALHHVNS